MALSRDGSSFWSRLRSRPNLDSPSNGSRPVLPMDIWNLLDEFSGVPPARGTRSRSSGSLVYEVNAIDRLFTDWLWLSNRSREREEKPPERVDTAAVLRKCRKVVYKPSSSSLWGKAKAETDQSECPVCLEKLVAKDKLLMLPCKHQFHVDCLTPWIKRNHACCPCCRADIRRAPKKDERASAAMNERNSILNFRQLRNGRGLDLQNEGNAVARNGTVQGSTSRQGSIGGEEDTDAWEGLHEYIMAALAEVDAELNRFMH